jgi:hypothetical protein
MAIYLMIINRRAVSLLAGYLKVISTGVRAVRFLLIKGAALVIRPSVSGITRPPVSESDGPDWWARGADETANLCGVRRPHLWCGFGCGTSW